MKKFICITTLVFIFMLTGCSSENPNAANFSSQPDNGAINVAFLSSMGCNDQNCTDVSHYHDCPIDCIDYNHYHSCTLDCSEAEHHHSQTQHQNDHQTNSSGVITTAFVSSMGCNDQNCTDASHYHDCPAGCTDYDHYHNCVLGCTETSHHHSGLKVDGDHGEHHNDKHH